MYHQYPSMGCPVKAVSKRYFDLTDREPSVQPVCINGGSSRILEISYGSIGYQASPKLYNFIESMMSKLGERMETPLFFPDATDPFDTGSTW